MTRARQDTAIVLAVALALRLVYAIQHSATIYFDHPILDSLWIHQWAQALVRGEGSGDGAYFRAPLYPMLLAGLYRAFGTSQWVVVAFQHLLGAATAVLCLRIGTAIGGRGVGLIAGLLWAGWWTAIFFEGEILIVTLATFLGTVVLERLIAACRQAPGSRGRTWRLASAGAALGLAAIARPNFLILAPLVAFAPWAADRRVAAHSGAGRPELRVGRSVLVALGSMVAVILPVTVRNLVVGHDLVPIAAQGGLNFYVGNGPDADGKTAIAPGSIGPMRRDVMTSAFRDNVTLAGREIAEGEEGRALKESEVSRYWLGRAVAFIVGDGPGWLRLAMTKCYYLINSFEISDNRDLEEARRDTPVLMWLAWIPAVVWPLALLGVLWGVWGARLGFLIVSFVSLYGFSVVLFFVNSRLRLPVMPGLLIAAAYGAVALVAVIRERRTRALLVAVGILGVSAAATHSRLLGVDEQRGLTAFRLNRAVLLIESGRCAPALDTYRELAGDNPDLTEAAFGLARAMERCGDVGGALDQYSAVSARWPEFPFAELARARLLADLDRDDEADAAYRRAIDMDPGLADGPLNYASYLAREQRFVEAVTQFERGLEMDPSRLKSWVAYGYTLARVGRIEDARAAFRRALALDPHDAAAQAGLRTTDAKPGP